MTEFEDAMAPFVEAEMKEHHAALIRQMVALGIVIFVMLGGTTSLIPGQSAAASGQLFARLGEIRKGPQRAAFASFAT